MGTITIITFRETFEMLLVIVPLLAYVTKLGRRDLSKYIYVGGISGLIASIICGLVLFFSVRNLEGPALNMFEGTMMMFLCGLIIYSFVWVGKQRNNFSPNIEDKYKIQTTGAGLFLLAGLTIFRECLEIILFLLPLASKDPVSILTEMFLGVLITIILYFVLYKTALRLNINVIFSILTLLLIYIGGMMFGEGLATLFPSLGGSIETAGIFIFAIPLLYFFIKREIRRYTRK